MTIARDVSEILNDHVTFQLECTDRLYLGLYVPILQDPAGVAWFWRKHRGHDFASSSLMAPMTERFVERIEAFAQREGVEIVQFRRGQRKDDVAKQYLTRFTGDEGVLFIGKAQERANVVRTERRRNPAKGHQLRLARQDQLDGQPLLLLCCRPGLRSVLSQVLLLLPV